MGWTKKFKKRLANNAEILASRTGSKIIVSDGSRSKLVVTAGDRTVPVYLPVETCRYADYPALKQLVTAALAAREIQLTFAPGPRPKKAPNRAVRRQELQPR